MTIEKPKDWRGWTEPESQATAENPPKYPHNHVTHTPSGHLFEMDDTPGRERIRLQHRGGTFTEIHSNGTEVHKIFGDGFEIIIKDKNVLVKGSCSITVMGDAVLDIKGDRTEHVGGNYRLKVDGDFIVSTDGNNYITCDGDLRLGAGASALGDISLIAGGNITASADVLVKGDLTASKIQSDTSVSAMTGGMFAGPLGFATIGGITAGPMVGLSKTAVPGQMLFEGSVYVVAGLGIGSVHAIGPITSAVEVTSPIGAFGVMGATWMHDIMNVGLNNIHIHPTPKGPSGPSLSPMVG